MRAIVASKRRPAVWSALAAERFVSHNMIMGVSTLLAGALGFFMQALLSHRLMPADFGIAFGVLSLLMLILLPTNAVMLVMAKETSRDHAAGRSDPSAAVMWLWHRYLMLGGFAIAAAGILGADSLSRFFNVPSAAIAPAALSIPFGLALPALLGQLQGRQRFFKLSLLLVGQAALRLVAAVGFAVFLGAVGVLIGVAVGSVLVYLLALGMVGRPRAPRATQRRESREAFRSLAIILPSSLALAVLFGTDVLLVKHFFNGVDAGRYAAVAALGRAIFWGASGITIVLFPKAALRASQGSSGVHLVLGSVAICLLGGLAGLAILSLGAPLILTVFAGYQYAAASTYLPWYAIAMTLFGGSSVLVANAQARGKADFLAVLIPVMLLEPVLIIAFHQTLNQVVQVLSLSMAVLFIGLAALYLVQERAAARPKLVLEGATA